MLVLHLEWSSLTTTILSGLPVPGPLHGCLDVSFLLGVSFDSFLPLNLCHSKLHIVMYLSLLVSRPLDHLGSCAHASDTRTILCITVSPVPGTVPGAQVPPRISLSTGKLVLVPNLQRTLSFTKDVFLTSNIRFNPINNSDRSRTLDSQSPAL